MEIVKIMWWNILSTVLTSARGTVGLEKIEISASSSRALDVFPGFQLTLEDDELRMKFNLEDMFPVTAVQSRALEKDEKKQPSNMQKFGPIMMMIPLIMQMMSIPVAIASIKMSLLKSIVVGKLALLLMLYNLVKNQQPTKTIVVQGPTEHHDHFYPHIHEEESEENDKGWFGSFG